MFHMFGSPEEMQEAMAKAEMTRKDFVHSIFTFLEELDQEELIALRNIMQSITNASDAEGMAAYYSGAVQARLQTHHGICPGCEVNHDEELKAEMEKETGGDTPAE